MQGARSHLHVTQHTPSRAPRLEPVQEENGLEANLSVKVTLKFNYKNNKSLTTIIITHY